MLSDRGAAFLDMALVAVLIGAVLLYSFLNTSCVIKVDITDDILTLSGIEDHTLSIPLDDIGEVVCGTDLDYGEPLDGTDGSDYRYGSWRSDTLGEYTAYTTKATDAYIELVTRSGIYVFNYGDNESTRSFSEALDGMLAGM